MNSAELTKAIENRSLARITERSGYHKGAVGIVLGYRELYGNVKIGFVDEAGNYTGDYTVVSADCIEPVREEVAIIESFKSGAFKMRVGEALIGIAHDGRVYWANDEGWSLVFSSSDFCEKRKRQSDISAYNSSEFYFVGQRPSAAA